MTPRRRSHRPAFTLLELTFALLVICVVLAIAAPNLRGWSRGARLRDGATHLIAMTQFARTQAAATGKTHRFAVLGGDRYVVSVIDGDQLNALPGSLGEPTVLPEGLQIQMVGPTQQPLEYIDFHPSGRGAACRIRITATDYAGDGVEIECATPTDLFRVVQTGVLQ